MLALDMTFMDQLLIRYVYFLIESFNTVEKVVFYHNIRLDYPERAKYLFKDLKKPLDEVLKGRMEKLVKELPETIKYEFQVSQTDDTAHDVLHTEKKHQVDLIIMGKKVTYEGSGYLIERVMHRDPKADLLLVPETSYHRFEQFLAPVDFSKKSAKALHKCLELADTLQAEVICQHVHNVPQVYFPFIPIRNLEKEMREESEREWVRFSKKYFPGQDMPEMSYSFHGDRSIAHMIYDFAVERQIDMIVVPAEHSIIQSTVIQLLKLNMHLPIWVVS